MSNGKSIQTDIDILQKSFYHYTKKIKKFQILSKKLVPDGLPPHTRSISWLVEEVILQKAKHTQLRKIAKVIQASSDIKVHDCEIILNGRKIFVNVKITQTSKEEGGNNDFNKALRIYQFLKNHPNARLFYVIIRFKFQNNVIRFINEPPTVIYIPWIRKFSVNSSNHHLQANYYASPEKRTTKKFLKELWKNKTVKEEMEKEKERKKLKKQKKAKR